MEDFAMSKKKKRNETKKEKNSYSYELIGVLLILISSFERFTILSSPIIQSNSLPISHRKSTSKKSAMRISVSSGGHLLPRS